MDVERTIEFILKSQANAERRMESAERRMESAERRMESAERRMDKVDRRLDGISKLIKQGMRILAETAEAQKRTDRRLAEYQKRTDIALTELAQAQKETQQSLKAFINSLRHGRNGRNGS
jgi:chromosome segregation ATPase